MPKNRNELIIPIENKFKLISGLDLDLTKFPIKPDKKSQVKTDKQKSKEHGEVFTPLWLVDYMISQAKIKSCELQTLDLCAGYGQFSIRLVRYLVNKFKDFSLVEFLKNHHFSEIQLSSCYKILATFNNVNLFIGDSSELGKLPVCAKGIWVYIESFGYWVCLTQTVKNILRPNKIICSEEQFVLQMVSLIQKLNETYEIMKKEEYVAPLTSLKMLSANAERRIKTIRFIKSKGDSLQKIHTPEEIVEKFFAGLDTLEGKSILVLFNFEIIEYLIHKKKVDPAQITFGIDDGAKFEIIFIEKFYGVNIVSFNKNLENFRAAEIFQGKKFDICFSNPPYTRGIDIQILDKLIGNSKDSSISKEYITVHPSSWLIDLKEAKEQYYAFKKKVNGKVKTVLFFAGTPVFNIQLHSPCIIDHIDMSHNGKVKIDCFGDKFIADSIFDVSKFGSHWHLVKPFFEKMKVFSQNNESIYSHSRKNYNNNLCQDSFYCRLPPVIGHESNERSKMFKDDFYRMTNVNPEDHKKIELPIVKPGTKPSICKFNSEIERNNFLKYVRTDFARFCLSLYKNSQNIGNGEMSLVPMLDFTEIWEDEKLFKHFEVSTELQNYIKKFLPDFHKIRKNNA